MTNAAHVAIIILEVFFINILFKNLGGVNFDISKIFAMNQIWDNGSSFTMNQPRPTNALLFFNGCDARIKAVNSDKSLRIQQGSLCIIPQGSMYTLTFYNNAECGGYSSMLFEFILTDENGIQINLADGIKIVDSINFVFYRQLFSELIGCFSKPQFSFPKSKAIGFSIIAFVSEVLCENGILKQKFSCIYNGIKYLETDTVQKKVLRK